uniref:Uncharacterized protein n=1 Tax=Oryza sativa subsp. indica TaxID=39946 RepID=Q0P197_ORYSI|nr:hypothetical protein TQB7A1.3 [Oryza sativa Indica Group]
MKLINKQEIALLAVDERGAEVPPLAQQDWTMILKYEEAHGGRFEKEEVVVVERRAVTS